MAKLISRENAGRMIKASKGKIFTVQNIKKDGSARKFNGRINVQKGVKGVGLPFNPDDHNLITIYDMKAGGFRMVNMTTVNKLTINKETYEVI